jgi:hypothetical protein
MINNKSDNKLRCSNCGSKLVYIRMKAQELVCRSCRHVDKLSDIEAKEDKNKREVVEEQ